jgi:KUP system potassium uptake protein
VVTGMHAQARPRIIDRSSAYARGLRVDLARTSYLIGREMLIPTPRPPRGPVEARAFLSAGNLSATAYFGIPPERVVELGTHLEI